MGSAGEHLQAGAAGPVTAPAEGLAAALPPDGSPDFDGRRALVCSLGREGRDLASWLIGHGANVTMCDTRTDAQLGAASADAPPGVDRVVTGRPFPGPDGFDLIGVSQSVLATDAVVSRARALGIPVISPMQLFLRLCPAPIIGITGSSGKSTTTALVGEMARQQGVAHVVAGNIGGPVLGLLGRLRPETTVILELSHTQLQYTDRSPALAAVTNVGPNHLDQFDWDAYVALKQNLLRWQGTDAMAVMNADDPTSCELTRTARGKVMRCWLAGEVDGPGAWVEDETRRRTSRRPRRTHRGDLGDRSAWATQPRQRGDGDGDCLRRRVVSGCRRRRPPAVSGPQVGDVILLSPAGTSFDAYANFESRGDAFRRAVQALPGFREAPMH